MTEVPAVDARRSIKALFATFALIGMLAAGACSSGSTTSTDGTTVAAGANAGDNDADAPKSGSDGGLPDGFPDIPLPDFDKVDVVKSGAGDSPGWSVLLTVDPTLKTDGDEILTAYVEQLEAAGYEIEGDISDASIGATKDGMDIHFHSSMDGTITVGVVEP